MFSASEQDAVSRKTFELLAERGAALSDQQLLKKLEQIPADTEPQWMRETDRLNPPRDGHRRFVNDVPLRVLDRLKVKNTPEILQGKCSLFLL
jgi:hypothetical protein